MWFIEGLICCNIPKLWVTNSCATWFCLGKRSEGWGIWGGAEVKGLCVRAYQRSNRIMLIYLHSLSTQNSPQLSLCKTCIKSFYLKGLHFFLKHVLIPLHSVKKRRRHQNDRGFKKTFIVISTYIFCRGIIHKIGTEKFIRQEKYM